MYNYLAIVFMISFLIGCGKDFFGEEFGVIKVNENPPTYEKGLVIEGKNIQPDLSTPLKFKVKLNTNPGKEVNFSTVLAEDSGNSTITANSNFSLNKTNWSTGVEIEASGVCDDLTDNATANISFISADYSYNIVSVDSTLIDGNSNNLERVQIGGIYIDNLSVVIKESPKLKVTPTQQFVTESGGTATVSVQLCTPPTSNVTVNIGITGDEANLSTSSMIFSSGNWSTNQNFVITGLDDSIIDGVQPFTVTLDTTYSESSTLDFNNYDNETREIIINKTSVSTSETGSTDTFTVALSAQPSANVNINISVLDTDLSNVSDEVSLDKSTITFTPVNFSSTQTITITGVDDLLDDGNQNYYIRIVGDGDYSSDILTKRIDGVNADND